jgi:sodium transport system permease protein
MYPVPILGQHLLATDVLGGKSPTPVTFAITAAAAMAAAALMIRLTTGMLRREKVIFAR